MRSGYFLKKPHSSDCIELYKPKENAKFKNMYDKTHFINECEGILNASDIYDRALFKETFKNIYNKYNYNFSINNDLLSNIISNWKRKSLNFTKYCIFQNKYDYNNDLILREFRFINNSIEKK